MNVSVNLGKSVLVVMPRSALEVAISQDDYTQE